MYTEKHMLLSRSGVCVGGRTFLHMT